MRIRPITVASKGAQATVRDAIAAEMNAPSADARRIIRDERIKLQARIQLAARGERTYEQVAEQAQETLRIVQIWGNR